MAKKEKNVKKRHSFFLEIKKSAKEEPFLFAVYFVLRFIVIAALVMSLVSRDYERSFVCLLVLVLFMIPAFVEKRLNIEIPNVLEIIILVFIFAAGYWESLKAILSTISTGTQCFIQHRVLYLPR